MKILQALKTGNLPVAIQLAGRAIGLEVRRNSPSARDDLRLAEFLTQHQIDLVFDIGANRGQFAEQLFANGYRGRIVSFEAMPHVHDELAAAAARIGSRWQLAPAVALSDRDGTISFHVNVRDTTSSLLQTSSDAMDKMPGARPQTTVEVPTRRLDDMFEDYVEGARRIFLKIDVQGGEKLVLAGAQKTLDRIAGLVIELSLNELYVGQPFAFDVLAPLLADGFEVHDISPAYRDPGSYRLEQIDAVLFHPDRID